MGELQMKSKITVEMPNEIVEAAQKAAKREYMTLSQVVRRSLVKELRESGLLQEEVA
jgi:Arc/MetJ-type ribon-helix-helix transcriptional regulator